MPRPAKKKEKVDRRKHRRGEKRDRKVRRQRRDEAGELRSQSHSEVTALGGETTKPLVVILVGQKVGDEKGPVEIELGIPRFSLFHCPKKRD